MQGMVELLDAILAKINAFSFVPTFTARRSYYPLSRLVEYAESGAIISFLVPGPKTIMKQVDRSNSKGESVYNFELGILKKVAVETDNTEIDPLMKLADNVRQFLLKQKFTTLDNEPVVITSDFDPSYDQDVLNKLRTFFSIIKFEVKWFQNV